MRSSIGRLVPSIVLPLLGITVLATTAKAELIRYEIDRRINKYQPGVEQFVGAGVGDRLIVVITIDSQTPDLNPDPAIGEFAFDSIEVRAETLSVSLPAGSGRFIVENDVAVSSGLLVDRFRMTCCSPGTIPSITGTTIPPGAILETSAVLQRDYVSRFRFPSDAFPVDFDFRDEWFFFGVRVKDVETNETYISVSLPEPSTTILLALGLLALLPKRIRSST